MIKRREKKIKVGSWIEIGSYLTRFLGFWSLKPCRDKKLALTAVSDFPALGIENIFPSWWCTCFLFSLGTVHVFPRLIDTSSPPRLAQVAWGWRLHVFPRLSPVAALSEGFTFPPRLASVTSFYSDSDRSRRTDQFKNYSMQDYGFCHMNVCFGKLEVEKGSDIKEFSLTV